MKKIQFALLALTFVFPFTSCTEWLEVYPQNQQVSDFYWTSKEDVDAVLNAGYLNYRNIVTSQLIPLGELRGGAIFSRYSNNLQEFRVKASDKALCNWGPFYQIINLANAVLTNADKARAIDNTYNENVMNAHKAEAYFLRALSYFYLVRNWRDVPLILKPYDSDAVSYKVAKSSESEVIAQIKSDILTALTSGAAKEQYDKTWENKGRATKWALCALMADVCLWDEDYENALIYSNMILNSNSSYAPRFLASPTHASWFSMFNPGNSNESILELQWDYQDEQTNQLPVLFDNVASERLYEYTPRMLSDFNDEYRENKQKLSEPVRSMWGGYYVSAPETYEVATNAWVWKYMGSTVMKEKRTTDRYDPHFILYRVADVMLMKAEALTLKGQDSVSWTEALSLVNKIRIRTNLDPISTTYSDMNEVDLLDAILHERRMELAGEAKCWYDLLRFGRRHNNRYKEKFLIDPVIEYNNQASPTWLRSVLVNDDALFLPIWENELKTNELLVQNPYYK